MTQESKYKKGTASVWAGEDGEFQNGAIVSPIVKSVTFSYKDYRQGAVTKEMSLEPLEFIRRFAMHILPKGFVRIRHYGMVSSTSKMACAVVIKEQL